MVEDRGWKIDPRFSGYCLKCDLLLLFVTKNGNHSIKTPEILHNPSELTLLTLLISLIVLNMQYIIIISEAQSRQSLAKPSDNL